ncbi:unnamed protein product [Closterium sp. Yama58-4]|nr:unnamed protein product [Closterium sp. Yama58-4]
MPGGRAVRVLNVAEKPSVARAVAEILARYGGGGVRSREGRSVYNRIFEFTLNQLWDLSFRQCWNVTLPPPPGVSPSPLPLLSPPRVSPSPSCLPLPPPSPPFPSCLHLPPPRPVSPPPVSPPVSYTMSNQACDMVTTRLKSHLSPPISYTMNGQLRVMARHLMEMDFHDRSSPPTLLPPPPPPHTSPVSPPMRQLHDERAAMRHGDDLFDAPVHKAIPQVGGLGCGLFVVNSWYDLYENLLPFRKWHACEPLSSLKRLSRPQGHPAGGRVGLAVCYFQAWMDKAALEVTLREEARRSDQLVLWLDCDREGENIAYEVMQVCLSANSRLAVFRAHFSALVDRCTHFSLEPLSSFVAREGLYASFL